MRRKLTTEDREQITASLRSLLSSRTRTVFAIVRSRAKSGMSRRIDFFAVAPGKEGTGDDVERFYLSAQAFALLNGYWPAERDYDDGLRFNGCGYDPAQEFVSHLSQKLFNEPRALRCERL